MQKLTLIILAVLTWNVIGIRSDVRQMTLTQQSTKTLALSASELLKYWLPPITQTRMGAQCSRCHK